MRTLVRMELIADIEVGTTADTLLPRAAFDGLALIQAGVAKLLHTNVDTHQLHEALELIDSVELISRQIDAAKTKVHDSIDLGRRRIFTGYARLTAQLQSHECYWPGCHITVTNCQIDHLTPHSEIHDRVGGLTNPHNAGTACGKHNRHKERGYTVRRLADGTIENSSPRRNHPQLTPSPARASMVA